MYICNAMWYALKRLSLGILLIALASAVLLLSDWNHRKQGASSIPRVAVFQFASRELLDDSVRGILEVLAGRGYIPGKTIRIRRYNAENDLPTANSIAKEIVDTGYDMVVTVSTPCLQVMAAANQNGSIRHVFGVVTDPFGSGVGIEKGRVPNHPKHLVGVGTFQPVKEVFQLAKKIHPSLKKVGVVYCPGETCSQACMVLGREICAELGIELLEAQVENSSGVLEAARSLVARNVQALWIGGDNIVEMAAPSVVNAARQGHIPVFANAPVHAQYGALIGLGADYYEVGKLTGAMAADVLEGADTEKMQVENCVPQELALNLDSLGDLSEKWSIPDDVLKTAAVVIQNQSQQTPTPAAVPTAAPDRKYRIGMVYYGPDLATERSLEGFLDGMERLGYVRGGNLEATVMHAQGEVANIPLILQNYDSRNLDLIVPFTTPCLVASLSMVKQTPVVFACVTAPLAAGAGTSYSNHHPNVTGVGSFPPVSDAIQLILDLFPDTKSIGTIYNPGEANSTREVEEARSYSEKKGIRFEEAAISTSNDAYESARALLQRGIQAFWLPGDNTALPAFRTIAKVLSERKIPIVIHDVEYTDQGALASVGVSAYEAGLAGSKKAARVLAGESPAHIPIENVAIRKVGLNFAMEKELGVTFPPSLIQESQNYFNLCERLGRTCRFGWAGQPSEQTIASFDVAFKEIGLVIGKDYAWAAGGKPDAILPADTPASSVGQAALTAIRGLFDNAASAKAVTPSKKWLIHLIQQVEGPAIKESRDGVLAGLKESGLREGVDYEVVVRDAQGDLPTLNTMVDAALGENADMVYTITSPALQVAMNKVRDRPVLYTLAIDPLLLGDAGTHEKHRPNVAGIYDRSPFEPMMDLIKECLPNARRIGTLYCPAEVNSVNFREEMEKAAKAAGLELIALPSNTPGEVSDAILALLQRRPDLVCQINDNIHEAAFAGIAQAAQRARVPVFSFSVGLVHQGASVVLSNDHYDGGRESGLIAARIIRGEDPADIPYSGIKKTKLLVNPQTADKVGLAIPASVLNRADVVVKDGE